jgi:hypothetical protein
MALDDSRERDRLVDVREVLMIEPAAQQDPAQRR